MPVLFVVPMPVLVVIPMPLVVVIPMAVLVVIPGLVPGTNRGTVLMLATVTSTVVTKEESRLTVR
jgi:hypothetical protein